MENIIIGTFRWLALRSYISVQPIMPSLCSYLRDGFWVKVKIFLIAMLEQGMEYVHIKTARQQQGLFTIYSRISMDHT